MDERHDTLLSERRAAAFWRNTTLMLIMFILGNGVAFVSFGLNTASKQELAKAIEQQNAQSAALQKQLVSLDNSMNELVGYLRGKKVIDEGIPPVDRGRD